MPPPPPPPPKEDDQAFVRRIRLTYMDKVIKEHEKHDLLEDHDELGRDTPGWVFSTMTLMPYLAACTFSCGSIFTVLAYGVKFLDPQAERWVYGSVIGLAMVVGLLEMFRIAMMTLVELRKFENRKKSKAGHFLPRRVKREDDKNYQEAPKPRLWKNSVAAPSVPKGHQNAFIGPSSKPHMDLPGVTSSAAAKSLPPLGPNTGAPPGLAHSGLPVVPPPPPPKSRGPANNFANAFGHIGGVEGIEPLERGYDRGPHTPTSVLSGTGPMGQTPPNMPGFPSPGTPERTLERSGTGSGSLGALRQAQQKSLSEQVKAGTQDRANKPPPPPQAPGSGPGSRVASRTGSPRSAATPPPPAAPPPVYSRPKSRPTSASKAPPSTPPGGPPAEP